jgi:hypothetical protein
MSTAQDALAAAKTALDAAEAQVASAVAAEAQEDPGAPDYQAIVQDWFNTYVANSPVSRATEAINHMTTTAVPALLVALQKKD